MDVESVSSDNEEAGITPRSLQYLFDLINSSDESYTVYLSFIQIYNEKIYDWLQDSQKVKPLQIREDKYNGKVRK